MPDQNPPPEPPAAPEGKPEKIVRINLPKPEKHRETLAAEVDLEKLRLLDEARRLDRLDI